MKSDYFLLYPSKEETKRLYWNSWKKNNSDKIKAAQEKYRLSHLDKMAEKSRKYRINHPDKIKIYAERLKSNEIYQEHHRQKERIRARANPEKNRQKVKLWRESNPEKYYQQCKKRYQETKEQFRIRMNKWKLENPEKNIVTNRKHVAKRQRELGFIPLNDCFENSHGHHLDEEHVLYIPEEIHKSEPHNVRIGKNMEIINKKAMDWYANYYGIEGFEGSTLQGTE